MNNLKIYDEGRYAIKADGTRLPIFDAPFGTIIICTGRDKKRADESRNKGDQHSVCVLAWACRRTFKTEIVWITVTLAYVEQKDAKGQLVIYRYILTDPARALLEAFDKGQHIPDNSVYFAAPKGSRTLEAMARAREKRRLERNGQPVNDPTGSESPKPAHIKGGRSHKLEPLGLGELRERAYGMFQFKTVQAFATRYGQ